MRRIKVLVMFRHQVGERLLLGRKIGGDPAQSGTVFAKGELLQQRRSAAEWLE
jgi:hypothetical protein